MMTRNGKTLKILPDGAPRRLSDGRNAWRKMSAEQRRTFLAFIAPDIPTVLPHSSPTLLTGPLHLHEVIQEAKSDK